MAIEYNKASEQHTIAGLPPDRPDFEYLTGLEKNFLLRSRAARFQAVGEMAARKLEVAYGATADITLTYKVFNKIARPLNQIFISQIDKAGEGLDIGESASWSMYDSTASTEFKNAVSELLEQGNDYSDFFSRNTFTREILRTVAEEFIDEKRPEKLGRVRDELERLAIEANDKGEPVFLFCMGASYTRSNANVEVNPTMLEADLRLIIPLPKEERAELEGIFQDGWDLVTHLHQDVGFELPTYTAKAIIGYGIGFAGSQIIERTQGEKFSSKGGFHISLNMLEDTDDIMAAFKMFLDTGDQREESLRRRVKFVIAIIDSFHEMSHEYTDNIPNTLLQEIGADIPAFAVALMMISQNKLPLFGQDITNGEFVTKLLGEYADVALKPITGSILTDSYRLCARYALLALTQSKLVSAKQEGSTSSLEFAEGEHLRVSAEMMLQQLVSDHKKLYAKDPDFYRDLESIDTVFQGSDAKLLAELFLQVLKQEVMPANVASTLQSLRERLSLYGDRAAETTEFIYNQIFKLRDSDRLVIVADSASDLAAVAVLAWTANRIGVETDVIYYRDLEADQENFDVLTRLVRDAYEIRKVDAFLEGEEVLVAKFEEGHYTACLNLTNASYKARTEIEKSAKLARMPVGEMPTVKIETLISPAYTADVEEMSKYADQLREQLVDAELFHMSSAGGTDLYFTVRTQEQWVDETKLDFSLRSNSNAPVDNIPRGVLYKNIIWDSGRGTIVIDQIDPDVADWAERILGFTADEARGLIYDPHDPISIKIEQGHIAVEGQLVTGISGGKRAEVLRKYYQAQFEREELAPLYLSEVAFGLNPHARSYQDGATAIVEMEKKRGEVYLAFGNSPVRDGFEVRDIVTADIRLDYIQLPTTIDIMRRDGSTLTLLHMRTENVVFAAA